MTQCFNVRHVYYDVQCVTQTVYHHPATAQILSCDTIIHYLLTVSQKVKHGKLLNSSLNSTNTHRPNMAYHYDP